MTAYLVRRVLVGILSIFFISVVSFIIIQMPPGDAVDAYTNYRENGSDGRPGRPGRGEGFSSEVLGARQAVAGSVWDVDV